MGIQCAAFSSITIPSGFSKSYLNDKNQLVADEEGVAMIEIWEDESDREIRRLFYSSDGSLHADEDGVCGKEYVYCDDGNGSIVQRYAELDLNGEPIVDEYGRMYYEDKGNPSSMMMKWFDKDMLAVKDRLGSYSRLGHAMSKNVYELIELDENGNPCNNLDGYCTEIQITDEAGTEKSVYLDVDGNFVNVVSRLGRKLFRRLGR